MKINKNIKCVRIKETLLEMYPDTEEYKKMIGRVGYVVRDLGAYVQVVIPALDNDSPYKIHKDYIDYIPCDKVFTKEIVADALWFRYIVKQKDINKLVVMLIIRYDLIKIYLLVSVEVGYYLFISLHKLYLLFCKKT